MTDDNASKFKFVPGFIRNDFWRKLVALFFAVLIWTRVAAQLEEEQILRNIPVSIAIPSGYMAVGNDSATTNLTVKGSRQRLARLKPSDVRVSLKIEKPVCGENKAIVTKQDVSLPPGVSVASIDHADIILRLDKKATKKVPVVLNITGSLLEDYTYAVKSIIPSEVRISGPESILREINQVQAGPIVLEKSNIEDFDCRLKLKISPSVSIFPSMVTARMDVFKKSDARTFDSLPVKPFGFPPPGSRGVEFNVKTVSVGVCGNKQEIELLIPDDLHPFVDISKIDKPGEYTLSVQCWSGVENVRVKTIKPKTIQVIVH